MLPSILAGPCTLLFPTTMISAPSLWDSLMRVEPGVPSTAFEITLSPVNSLRKLSAIVDAVAVAVLA